MKKEKLTFIFWSPDTTTPQNKLIYASTKEVFKGKLTGITVDIQAVDMGDVICYSEFSLTKSLLKLISKSNYKLIPLDLSLSIFSFTFLYFCYSIDFVELVIYCAVS